MLVRDAGGPPSLSSLRGGEGPPGSSPLSSENRKLSRDRLQPTVSYERIFWGNVLIESRDPVVAISTSWNYEAGYLSSI